MTLKGDFPNPEQVAALTQRWWLWRSREGSWWTVCGAYLGFIVVGGSQVQVHLLPSRRVHLAWHVIPCSAGVLLALLEQVL
jgi:hypothetical protein